MSSDLKMKRVPEPESGHFHWNAGAWWGSLLGGSAYLMIGAVAFATRHPLLSIIWAACFAASWLIGIVVWRKRSSIAAYPAYQSLVATCGLAGVIAIIAASILAPKMLAAVNLTPLGGLAMLFLFPAIMLQFHLLEKMALSRKQK